MGRPRKDISAMTEQELEKYYHRKALAKYRYALKNNLPLPPKPPRKQRRLKDIDGLTAQEIAHRERSREYMRRNKIKREGLTEQEIIQLERDKYLKRRRGRAARPQIDEDRDDVIIYYGDCSEAFPGEFGCFYGNMIEGKTIVKKPRNYYENINDEDE